jgi:hypothetical protein
MTFAFRGFDSKNAILTCWPNLLKHLHFFAELCDGGFANNKGRMFYFLLSNTFTLSITKT